MTRPARLKSIHDTETGKLFKPIDATPQRLARAANDNEVTKEGARRLTDYPLARLAAQGRLDDNPDTNRALYEAGARYAAHAHGAGHSGPAAMDYSKVVVDCGSGAGGGAMDARLRHGDNLRRAAAAMLPRNRVIVDAVVLHENGDLVGLGRDHAGHSGRHAARAVALDRLQAGLLELARHFGMQA